ncbi:molybdate ABC transporter substrate-binding protein [Aneurinibacillus thermoaerophilus]|uniref:molybdate ABC transporter substrate-binding protein n=1 Tax=Aneurinibacillus thermoaerophilus TaxID=143495 RepID=UPI002E2191AC|nr:molybdate ABC transporter substrate-binding protein [Aneurinibacillus thermoaerophilus]
MLKQVLSLLLVLLLFVLAGCTNSGSSSKSEELSAPAEKVELTISAAASLTDALKEIKAAFEKENSNTIVTYTFGSSGRLAKQIEQGAPIDAFLSASKKDMDTLQDKNLIAADTRVDFAANELVLVAPKDSSLHIDSFDKLSPEHIKQLAVGEPESVPAGRYTKETLEKIGLWNKLQDKLVLGKDVRQVLTYVESGNADVGVVYASDARISKKVKVLAIAKSEWHKPIVYPGAVTANTQHADQAKAFLKYLASKKGKEILEKYGFK